MDRANYRYGWVVLTVSVSASMVQADVFLPGTQPAENGIEFAKVAQCVLCHGDTKNGAADPYFSWLGGMMAQSARDPVFRASFGDVPDSDLETFVTSAVANTYIAIEHMVLTTTALGLGSCWVGALGNPGEIKALFGLPETTVVVAVLPVGYPVVTPPPRPRISLSEILLRPLEILSR